ncbi:hypothetical protein AB1Y20_003886 [Prymnesium parvum]|uniref:Elongation factor Ts, mitochondrial n=1 Tax=Prymnesium parvum TaxID=97485 RepID=A0AB34J8J9_PRYPA
MPLLGMRSLTLRSLHSPRSAARSSPRAVLSLSRALSQTKMDRTSLIKDLRARTAAPMKKCVEALDKASGDLEEAISELRKIGLATAQKKASRGAHDGVVCLARSDHAAALVEINSETDFVARNQTFQSLASSIARTALHSVDVASASSQAVEIDTSVVSTATLEGDTVPVAEALGVAVGQLGENLVLRRGFVLAEPTSGGVVCSYVHNTYSPNVGRTAAMVSLASTAQDRTALESLGTRIAMHIVAASPLYLNQESVPADALQKEIQILKEQALGEGKPEKIVNKMVEGRLKKYYSEMCLLEQQFLIDEDAGSIKKVLATASKELGATVKLESFARLHVGESSPSV